MEKSKINLSVIIPYFGCDEALKELCEAIEKELSQLKIKSEVIFILDGANGGSWNYLKEITASYGYLSHQLTRNFGQHGAIKAGLSLSRGSTVIVMDCDLQDPPSLIPTLLESATKDIEVVFAKRRGKYDGFRRRSMRKASNFILKLIYPRGFDLDTGSYMLLKRVVVDQILLVNDNSHVGLLVNWLNYPSATVSYSREARLHGESSYSFRKLLGHGIEALSFNMSYFFRRLIFVSVFTSITFSIFGFLALISALTSQTSPGWASIFILLSIGFSINLTLLSLVGFTISDKLSGRNLPTFLIREDG